MAAVPPKRHTAKTNTMNWQSVCERKSISYFGEIEICLRCQPESQANLFIFKQSSGTFAFGLTGSDGLIRHIEHSGIETIKEVIDECERWYKFSWPYHTETEQ